jgi:FkbM family methyltransferase
MNSELLKKCAIDFGCSDGEWNQLQKEFITENYKENWNYCDVGSCKGVFTNLFKTLNPNKIYAFDINLKNPVMDNCIFERLAISDIDGTEKVFNNGDHESHIFEEKGNSFLYEIGSVRLDTYFKDKDIDCLKIDIEGAETKAIRGGIETISRCSLVMIECHLIKDWSEIFKMFRDNNLVFRNLLDGEVVTEDHMPYQIYKIQ